MDDVKRVIFVALMAVAVEIVIKKSGMLCGKRSHHLKSGLLILR